MPTEITADFCAICREEELSCDYITRCGHSFHFKCLWTSKYNSETTKECPYCRQSASNFIEKEKLIYNIKRLKLDSSKIDELTKFVTNILDFKKSSAYTYYDDYYSRNSSPFTASIPSYGKEMMENLDKISWNINSSAEGGAELLQRVCEKDDLYRLNLLIDFGLKLDPGSEYEKLATNTATNYCSRLVLERINEAKLDAVSLNIQSITLQDDSGDQLIDACRINNFEKVKALIEKGTDVNFRDSRGARPLHKACSSSSIQIINYLIENGAEVNCIDLSGKSPLHEACISKYERKDVVKRLLESNAKVSYLDQDKNTQLHVAIISRKYEIAELLVDHYDNVNCVNIFNESPLHLASDYAPKSLIEKLIEKGSEINAKDFKERSPLHRAVALNSVDVVDFLLEKGADANQVDKNKNTAILLAIKRTSALPFVSSLVKHGADLNVKDSNGKTALENYVAIYK